MNLVRTFISSSTLRPSSVFFRLRQLSGGNSVSTPPPSPAPGFGKYKLAEYRYGREEMLALFTPSQKMPEELAEFSAIITEKGQDPLALLPFTEEEQVSNSILV